MKNNHPKITRIFTAWACAVLAVTFGTVPALAAADPLTVVNNLSDFLNSSAPAVDADLPAVTMAWKYIGQLIFNMLVLTGLVKGADRIVREMFGL